MADTSKYGTYEFTGIGLSTSERRWGQKRFSEYLEIYPHIHKLSDLQLLEELVFMEAIQERLKHKVARLEKKTQNGETESEVIPSHLQTQLTNNLEQILILKEKLGLFETKEKLDAFADFQGTLKKFDIWMEKNQGSREITCPFCSEIFFLKIRTDKYEAIKYPFFQDKFLCNPFLHQVYIDGAITKDQYASILGTSPDFIDWLDEKWFKKSLPSA